MGNRKALSLTCERCPHPLADECVPPRVQKHSSTMLMEAPSHPFSSGMICVDGSCLVCCRWAPFFFLSLSSFKNYSLTLFIICISTSILIHFIFLFLFLILFIKVLFVFNLIIPSQFVIYYFFNLILIFF